jgi:hypothetical protein
VVPPVSRPITRVGRYSGTPLRKVHGLRLPGSHRLWRNVPIALRLTSPYASVGPTTPRPQGPRFGLCPVRSPLLRASRLISLSCRYLDVSVPCVGSPACAGVTTIAGGRVSPFGHPGIKACVPLPQAYRSLPRPSSPSCAKASSTCIRSLDHNF